MLNPHVPAFSIALYAELYSRMPATLLAATNGVPEILVQDHTLTVDVLDGKIIIYVDTLTESRIITTHINAWSDNFNYFSIIDDIVTDVKAALR